MTFLFVSNEKKAGVKNSLEFFSDSIIFYQDLVWWMQTRPFLRIPKVKLNHLEFSMEQTAINNMNLLRTCNDVCYSFNGQKLNNFLFIFNDVQQ